MPIYKIQKNSKNLKHFISYQLFQVLYVTYLGHTWSLIVCLTAHFKKRLRTAVLVNNARKQLVTSQCTQTANLRIYGRIQLKDEYLNWVSLFKRYLWYLTVWIISYNDVSISVKEKDFLNECIMLICQYCQKICLPVFHENMKIFFLSGYISEGKERSSKPVCASFMIFSYFIYRCSFAFTIGLKYLPTAGHNPDHIITYYVINREDSSISDLSNQQHMHL